jgi:hypothetical protein
MIARTAIMPQILFIGRRGQHDRVSDIAILGGPRRHRGVGWTGMSAEIIRRVPRSDGSHQQLSKIAFRSAVTPADQYPVIARRKRHGLGRTHCIGGNRSDEIS